MNSKLLSLLAGVGIVASAFAPDAAHAVNINTNALVCHTRDFQSNPPVSPDLIRYQDDGIYNWGNFAVTLVCPVPRSPLAIDATSGAFWIDGYSYGGALTYGLLYSYGYDGTYHGSASFSTTSPVYDLYVSLPSSMLQYYDYVSLDITLPGAPLNSGAVGKIRGITAVQ